MNTTAELAKLNAPPAANTRSRHQSRIPAPTAKAPSLVKRLRRVKNEVHKTLAVLDKATGKMMNYRQLLNHPAYHADWTLSKAPTPSNSSANQTSRQIRMLSRRNLWFLCLHSPTGEK
jgi:hypothetical protein